MDTPTLHDYLTKKLEQKRKDHPSFRLMKIDDSLFPDGIITFDTERIEAKDSENKLKNVKEIIAESWEKRSKNHLMIEGEGGIGKTVTLLSIPDKFTPFPIPAIYIPLHELTQKDNPIEYYIKRWILNNKEDLFELLSNLIDQPWDKGPQLLLLLDGFNEIAAENRQIISEDIEHWSAFPGIQIITSSRYDIHTYVALSYDYSAIKLQPLSDKTVESYLNSIGIPIPINNVVTSLITNPLLLTLYVKTELILRQRETDFSDFKEVKNAGTIVWNYLQCELWRFEKEETTAKNAIIAMEFISPYIAWEMQQKSLFVFGKKEFKKLLEDAYKLLGNHFNKPADFPFHIQEALQNANGMPPLELIKNLLEKHLCLFIKYKQQYRLMHQQFRDALAAMHLINLSYLSDNSLPLEWETPIDYYVMRFVADLISEEEATRLWNQNRNKKPAFENATRNQLELQKRLHNGDFSELDFSNLDLGNISLYPYRVDNNIKLPDCAIRFNKTVVTLKTFLAETCDGINAIAITPDGKRIISGEKGHTIQIWNPETGGCIKTLEGHSGSITSVAITPDGKCVVSGSEDCSIRIWDLEGGSIIRIIGCDCIVNHVAVTPNGQFIVSGSYDKKINIWELSSGICIKTLDNNSIVNAVAVSPNGQFIVSGSCDNKIRIWNWGSRNSSPSLILEGHDSLVKTLTVTPDNTRIISGSYDKTIRVWDLETGDPIRTIIGHDDRITGIDVNNTQIISGSYDKTIRVWDLETGLPIRTIKGHNNVINAVAIRHKGKWIISGSYDKTIRVWDLETGHPVRTIEGCNNSISINAFGFSPDSSILISCSNDNNRMWEFKTGNLIGVTDKYYLMTATTTKTTYMNDLIIGTSDGVIQVLDLDSKKEKKLLKGHNDRINDIKVTSNGRYIISGSNDQTVRIWRLENGENVKTINNHKSSVNTITLTKDEKYIVSGASNGTICITNLDNFEAKTIQILPLKVAGLNFSKAEISDGFREQLRHNGANV